MCRKKNIKPVITNNCIFCNYDDFILVAENDLSYAIRDKYPVTDLHTLIISKSHFETVFDLSAIEISSILELAKKCRIEIMTIDSSVKGFNFGVNSGSVAGQNIEHVHFHLIPRREGDVEPPAAVQNKAVNYPR